MSLQNVFYEVVNNLANIRQEEKSILIMGLTGTGKTALCHYLGRNPNLRARSQGLGQIKYFVTNYEGEFQNLRISERSMSQTSVPTSIQLENQTERQTFRDLPGFLDNRDDSNFVIQDLKNFFYAEEVFKKTRSFKLIILASIDQINSRDVTFSSTITKVMDSFSPAEWQNIKKSFCLVISKTPRVFSREELREHFNQWFQNNPRVSEFINFLINEDQIGSFSKPDQIGNIDFTGAQAIWQKIGRLNWSNTSGITHAMVSDKTIRRLKEMTSVQWQRKIASEALNPLKKVIQDQFKTMYQQKKKMELKEKLMAFKKKMKELLGSEILTIGLILSGLEAEFQGEFEKERIFFKNIIDLLGRMENILNHERLKIYDEKQVIQDLMDISFEIEKDARIHYIDKYDFGIILNKTEISSGNINDLISKNSEISDFFIFKATEMKFLANIEAGGKSLFLIAPKIIVQSPKGEILINLRGQNGLAYKAIHNADGCRGRPGKNGGSLYVKVDTIQNGVILVDMSGGDGGNGQDVEIVLDQDTIIEEMQKDVWQKQRVFLSKEMPYCLNLRLNKGNFLYGFKKVTTFNDQTLQIIRNDTEKAQKKYCNKYPGDYGKAGFSGQLVYLSELGLIQDKIIIKNRLSSRGERGTITYNVYEGKYIKERLFDHQRYNNFLGKCSYTLGCFNRAIIFPYIPIDPQFQEPIFHALVNQDNPYQLLKSIDVRFLAGNLIGSITKITANIFLIDKMSQANLSEDAYPIIQTLAHMMASLISTRYSNQWESQITFESKKTTRVGTKPQQQKTNADKVYDRLMEPTIPIKFTLNECQQIMRNFL